MDDFVVVTKECRITESNNNSAYSIELQTMIISEKRKPLLIVVSSPVDDDSRLFRGLWLRGFHKIVKIGLHYAAFVSSSPWPHRGQINFDNNHPIGQQGESNAERNKGSEDSWTMMPFDFCRWLDLSEKKDFLINSPKLQNLINFPHPEL